MSDAPHMDTATFLRRHADRSPMLMWLLGAGASASAGIATAGQMTWDFKRTIFCSEERVPIAACQDLTDPRVRERIDRHFARGNHPRSDAPEEYAHYFELAHQTERDRRSYIDAQVAGASPSFGHAALATLMAAERARIVWTTNFDPCVETACARVFDSAGRLSVCSPDNPELAEQVIGEERWPLLGKLHGDFRSQRLKNTADELRQQDARLRRCLTDSCKRAGLVVVGYSGRDESVMKALAEAAVAGGFPAGLFWIQHAAAEPLPAVEALIRRATEAGIDAAIVTGETFDEMLGDAMRQTPGLPAELVKAAERQAPRCQDAPVPAIGQAWPVIRANALLVSDFPTVCRSIQSDIGGVKALRAAIDAQGVTEEVIAARTKNGILAFGSDQALKAALAHTAPRSADLHAIEVERLGQESGEHGLLVEACARALTRERPLLARRRRRGWVLVIDPKRADDEALAPLVTATGALYGRLPSGGYWGEAVGIRLDYRLGRLWLLLEPLIWLSRSDGRRPVKDMDFVRERRAKRYNAQSSGLMEAWVSVLLEREQQCTMQAFGGTDGVDAVFGINQTTAYSRRAASSAAQLGEAA